MDQPRVGIVATVCRPTSPIRSSGSRACTRRWSAPRTSSTRCRPTPLTDFAQFPPPAVFARAMRTATRLTTRLRAAGQPRDLQRARPAQPLYTAGARLLHYYPVSTIVDGQGLNITVQSYLDTARLRPRRLPRARARRVGHARRDPRRPPGAREGHGSRRPHLTGLARWRRHSGDGRTTRGERMPANPLNVDDFGGELYNLGMSAGLGHCWTRSRPSSPTRWSRSPPSSSPSARTGPIAGASLRASSSSSTA